MGIDKHDALVIGSLCLIVAVVIATMTFFGTRGSINSRWEREAVKHNAATWTVDENGNRVFKWKGE